MAKDAIKLNKKHGGKEFQSSFRFIGQVKPVRKKEEGTENWIDVPLFHTTKTRTGKDRRVLQFNVETAFRNELKVELAGMEREDVFLWSSKDKQVHKLAWDDRFDKTKYPNDTYHLIAQEWDKSKEIGDWIQPDMWVDVRGKYEFSSFTNEDGKEINTVKRIINQVYPLKNGEVIIKQLKEGEEFRVYNSEVEGLQMGYGKADKDGVATIKVGGLNPEGGIIYICKVDNGEEGKRIKLEYTEGITESDRFTVKNNLTNESEIMIYTNGNREKVTYIRDFNDENFKEINSFEMQIGIKSTYQDEESKNTKINAVFLDYGKEKSIPRDVELMVYYKEPEEGKTALADAFARLNRLDFLEVTGVDNNRAEFALVEVEETNADDNPFVDVEEKEINYERVISGTKKGLEVLSYVTGTFQRGLLTEEEISLGQVESGDNPFADIDDDSLPF